MHLRTWFAPIDLLTCDDWTLVDALWALSGYVVVEQEVEEIPITSLTIHQKLFSLEMMWADGVDFGFPESRFHEDLVFIRISDGSQIELVDIKTEKELSKELERASKTFSNYRELFKLTADIRHCEIWFEPNKPFHLLSQWKKSYILRWAFEKSLKIEWLKTSIEKAPMIFKEQIKEAVSTPNLALENNWKVKESLRERDYGSQLIKLLKNFLSQGLQPPSENEVLKIWREDTPWGIYEVTEDSFRFKLKNGKMSRVVSVKNLRIGIEARIIWLT